MLLLSLRGRIMADKILWVDLETTGLDNNECAIVQIAALLENEEGKIVDSFVEWVKPHRTARIDEDALEVIGKTREELDEGIEGKVFMNEFIDFLGRHIDRYNSYEKLVFAGYNVKFDLDFLAKFFKRNGYDYFFGFVYGMPFDVGSMVMLGRIFGVIDSDNLNKNSLEAVCRYLDVKLNKKHDALDDIRAVRSVYYDLLGRMIK